MKCGGCGGVVSLSESVSFEVLFEGDQAGVALGMFACFQRVRAATLKVLSPKVCRWVWGIVKRPVYEDHSLQDRV